MKLSHIFLLLMVAAVWGFNFVPIRIGLNHLPPLTFTALRFFATIFPAVFFVKRPAVPLGRLAAYGIILYAAQFAFLFSAIQVGLPAGLASLVVQVQVFFTIGLAAIFMKEKPDLFQILGAIVAGAGIAFVAMHTGGELTWAGLLLAMVGAFCWSVGNLLTKSFGKANMFGIVVWGNLFAWPVMMVIALLVDGPRAAISGIAAMPLEGWLSLAYIIYGSTFFGYTMWSVMMARHSAASVVPFTLLIPIFAMLGAALFLGESFPLWKFEAAALILMGLALNQFGGHILEWFDRTPGN